MANNAPHIANDLLRRFISGELGLREEAQLERLAREDEGLAEALAGIRLHPEVDHTAKLQNIRQQLGQQAQKPAAASRRKLYRRLSAAAAILVLISTSLLFLPTFTIDKAMTTEAPPLADSELPRMEAEPDNDLVAMQEPRTTAPSAEKEVESAPEPAAAPPPAQRTKPKDAAQNKPTPPEATTMEESPDIIFDDGVANVIPPPPPPPSSPKAYETTVAPALSKRSMAAPSTAAPRNNNIITGFVTDEQDRPIENANILLPGQPIGERTDSSGYFRLATAVNVSNFEVEHPNYTKVTINLPRGENEVVISMESLTQETAEDGDTWALDAAKTTIYLNEEKTAAAPVGGMKALRQNIREAKPTNLSTGKVKVSFTVQPDGSLTDFEFGNRSEKALIPFVQNYLSQQSDWKLSGGATPARMSLTFRFD